MSGLGKWLGRGAATAPSNSQRELSEWLTAQFFGAEGGGAPALPADLDWLGVAVQPLAARLREQRRELEATAAMLQSVMQSADSAILAVSADHQRLYANAAAESLFGLPAGESSPVRLASLQRIPLLAQWIEAVAADGEPAAGRLQLSDDRTLQAYVNRLPGNPPGCVVVARDISETVRLETARRDFIAAISHELRTPLTSIQGYAEILKENPGLEPAMRDQFLDVMVRNTTRLTQLARDLVTLSSLETGTFPFHFERVNASALVAPAVAVVSPLAAEARAKIVVQALAPGTIRVDPEALHRVLLNLLENALVHGGRRPGGERPLEVYISGQIRGGEYGFAIRDTGVGIASSDRPRVFERFYRVAGGADRPHGTGLGLALVKHIVREHGGRVELSSVLGEGSTFWVWLPLTSPPEPEAAVAEPADIGHHG